MEIKHEIIEDSKNLTQEQKNIFAAKLASNFSQWDSDRNSQITTARAIMEHTYLMQPAKKYEGDLAWKSDVRLNTLYNIKRTAKSVIWREMWSNPRQMFDVRGTDKKTDEDAKMQKAAIVDSLEKMEIGKQYDQAIDDMYDIGEMIFKTDWEQRVKVVKRQKKDVGFILQNIVRKMTGSGFSVEQPQMKDVQMPYYENARVEAISPFMFVFDHSRYKLKNKASWDSCIKISKRFDSLENIKNNKVYTISDDEIAELSNDKNNSSAENKELINLRDENIYGGQFSVLYAHGDFKIDGKLYKNYIAEVLAGKYLIRFEENPIFVNPFIVCAYEYDPVTKRGIPKAKAILNMCNEEEKLVNTAFDVQKLTANPPCWVDEKFFGKDNTEKDGKLTLYPGKMIKIKDNFSGLKPTEVTISASGISDLLALLGQKISDVSSVSSVMFGNVESKDKTATELSLADKGSSSQYSKELDIISQDLTMPMVKNVAELLAMFKDGIEYVYLQEKGKNVEYKITNQIRQAQYNYIYEDRNAILDRKNKFQEMFQIFQAAGENPELFDIINWREVLTTAVEMIGYDNPEKFFNDESPETQIFERLKTLPEPFKQQLIPIIGQAVNKSVQQSQILTQQTGQQEQMIA